MKSKNDKKHYIIGAVAMLCVLAGLMVYGGRVSAVDKGGSNDNTVTDNGNGTKDENDKSDDNKESDTNDDKSLEETYNEKGYLTLNDLDKVEFGFDKEQYTIIVSDYAEADVKCNVPESLARVEYLYTGNVAGITDYNYMRHTAQLSGYYAGSSKLIMKLYVTYSDEKGNVRGEKTYSAEAVVNVLSRFDAHISVGDSYTPEYRNYEYYKDMSYVIEGDTTSVELVGNEIIGIAEGTVSVYLEAAGDRKIYIGQVSVSGNDIAFEEETVNRAVDSEPYQLKLNNPTGKNITWFTSSSAVVTVDSTGVVTPVAVGTATITAFVNSSASKSISYTCTVNITNPVIDAEKTFNLAKGYSMELGLKGTSSKGVWKSSKKSVAEVYSNTSYYEDDNKLDGYDNGCTLNARKKGEAEISVTVDGVIRKVTVTVTAPQLSKTFCIVAKGGKQIIKVTGINSKSKVIYKSSKPNVATVTAKGVVKAKKTGYSTVLVSVDGASYTVAVNVGSRKAVKAVMNALKVEGATYSQARRMQKGYYDCSSLVWRSYKPVGMNFGDNHYAPVAASQAAYCVNHKMTVSTKKVKKYNVSNLNVGDVIYFAGAKNGRYKNIYHVVIYMGRECYGYGDNVYTSGRIIHANGSKVSQSSLYNHANIVVVGRPFK